MRRILPTLASLTMMLIMFAILPVLHLYAAWIIGIGNLFWGVVAFLTPIFTELVFIGMLFGSYGWWALTTPFMMVLIGSILIYVACMYYLERA